MTGDTVVYTSFVNFKLEDELKIKIIIYLLNST
jgi:hypothetical protein